MSKRRETSRQAISPLGEPTEQTARRRRQSNPDYAAEAARVAPFEAMARLVIKYRLEHDLTQKELAHKIGTSHSAVSRLESGQATVSLKTMKRVAEALGGRLLVGFEIESGNHEVVRDLVAV